MATDNTAANLTNAQLQGILSIADDAIICFDSAQRIILFNHGAERIFGWSAEEATGQEINLLLPPRYRSGHTQLVQGFRQSGEIARKMGERRSIFAMRRDGTEVPAEASISKLEVATGVIYTVILRDISARKSHDGERKPPRKRRRRRRRRRASSSPT